MIGDAAHETLIEAGRGEDVAHQVSDMVAEAVHRALVQLNGGTPERQPALGEGGRYKFAGRVDESPPAQDVSAPKRTPDMAAPPKSPDMKPDEKPRNRNDPVPWVL